MPRTHRPTRTATHLACAVLLAVSVLLAVAPAGVSAGAVAAGGDDPIWGRTAARFEGSAQRTVSPRAYAAYTLDRGALLEQVGTGRVEIPDPTGRLVAFDVTPSPVLEPELAAAHPELRTWAGTAVEGPASIRMDSTPAGVHVSVRGDGPAWYVDPAYRDSDSLHLSYTGADLPAPERGLVEPTLPPRTKAQLAAAAARTTSLGEDAGALVTLRTYRLALLSDPTYAAFVAPGAASNAASDAAVLAAKTTLVNRLDQIYGDDLSIRLQLIAGTDTKLNLWTAAEASGANGPCGLSPCFPASMLADGCELPLLDRQRWVVGHLMGARNYDVGHFVLGINGGGVAYLDSVGHDTKAGGCTGLSQPSGDAYTVDFLAHELGHQFGADHTFDGSAGSCSGQRATDSAVEPGSGSTIMGYAGICGADDLQAHSDPVFSTASRDAIDAFVSDIPFVSLEWQSVAFSQLDGTDSFKLQFGATQTGTITRGSTYTADGIKQAVLAALPGGTVLQVKPFFFDGSFDDRGFSLFFTLYGGVVGGDVPEPTVVPVAGTFTSSVNDIDAGNPSATSAGATTTTANHNPTVTAPADKTIPVRTPISLTGSATDSDGNPLGYLWEQTDLSGSGVGVGLATEPKTAGPLFRVFGAASSTYTNIPAAGGATRSFPDLAQVVAGNTNADTGTCPAGPTKVDCLSEWLPTAAYTGSALHLRLTARDASPQGGGTATDDVVLTLDKSSGPFRVTSQTAGGILPGGSSQTVTWTTGTSTLAPNVKVSLSTDGGLTFPTVLLTSTPNDGSQAVNLPDLSVSSARLKVEAVGNYFYDVNDAPFAIQATGAPPPLVIDHAAVPDTVAAQLTDAVTASFSAATGQGSGALVASATGLPAGVTVSAKTVTSASAASWSISGTPTAAPASYPTTVSVTDGVSTDTFPVTVVVDRENATVVYTGPASVVGPDWAAESVPVTLSAVVTQAADGSLGAINAATVTFTDTFDNDVLCTGPVTTGGTGPGTATCTFAADLSELDSVQYKVGLAVGGAFVGASAADTVVTVSLPDEPADLPPDTKITSGPSGWLMDTTARFGFVSTVPDEDTDFLCRLDGARLPCPGPLVTLSELSQRTHVFTVAAEDEDGDRDESPAASVFAVPLDDAGLTPTGTWKRKRNGSSYLGTYSQAKRKGASLSWKVSDVRELALLVRTGKRYGAVKVFLDGTLLSTVKTAGKAGSKTFRIGHFSSARSGTVRIVSTSGRVVRIDGLGVSTEAF